jgi:uroporphyrinogen decarboxylase
MASMTPRQRVLAALNHEEVDRVPIDLGGTPDSTICTGAYLRFVEWLGVKISSPRIIDVAFDLVEIDEAVLKLLPTDTRPLLINPPERSKMHWLDESTFVDEWGITYRRPLGRRQFDMIAHPLAEATVSDIERYNWPDVKDPGRYAGLREKARQMHEETEFAICASPLDTSIFERACWLRGTERFLTDLLLDPPFALALLEKVADVQFELYERFLREVGSFVDVVIIEDDIGIQTGPLVRPELYRQVVKPFHRRYVELIRQHTDAKIIMHSCGSIVDLIEDYIEIGIDALNPMQVSAAGMSPENLAWRFAGRIAFWGGIDTQQLLPRGRPEDVREAVRHIIQVMNHSGGYILAAVHNIQDDVPPENIWAMLDEAASLR